MKQLKLFGIFQNTDSAIILEDFWQPLYDWHIGTILSVIVSSITLIVGIPLLYNVYEFNNDKHYK